jgi:hypothetical protein
LLFLCIQCGNNFPPDVDEKNAVLDSIYGNHQERIRAFVQKIETAIPRTTFKEGVDMMKDSLILDDLLPDILSDQDFEASDSTHVTFSNSIVIEKKGNLKLGFNPSTYDSDFPDREDIYLIGSSWQTYIIVHNVVNGNYTLVPKFFHYYTNEDYFKNSSYKDSITKKDKERLIKSTVEDLQQLDSIKYYVVLDHLLLKEPTIVDDETFESGMLIYKAQLFDIASNQFVNRTAGIAINSDSLDLGLGSNLLEGNIKEMNFNRTMYSNLKREQFKDIIKAFDIKED